MWRGSAAGVARLHLAAWCAIAVAVFAVRPVHFSLQFMVGVGLPLLALAGGAVLWLVVQRRAAAPA